MWRFWKKWWEGIGTVGSERAAGRREGVRKELVEKREGKNHIIEKEEVGKEKVLT